MFLVPAGFAVLLSAQGGEASSSPAAAAGDVTRSASDRSARVTFRLSADSLGMRILRGAPRETRLVRGRRVRVLCGSVSGLVIRESRWARDSATLRISMPERAAGQTEFCALKRGRTGVARVVFP